MSHARPATPIGSSLEIVLASADACFITPASVV